MRMNRLREHKETVKPSRWLIMGEVFTARTKSEARALAKKHFGLKRLPVRTMVRRIGESEE